MERFAKPVEERFGLLHQGIAVPGSEGAPMVLDMLPKDYNEIEFWAVRRQIQQHETMSDQPEVDDLGVYDVMHGGVIRDQ